MNVTADDLIAISPYCRSHAATYIAPLNAAMAEFQINTPLRAAAFLAQVLHESGSLQYVREIASGAEYNGRRDLGNTHPGWGELYKGRGLLQVTGFYQYCVMEAALKIPCTAHPELLEQPENACRSAAYFWASHGLNVLADLGTDATFVLITKRINGGTNGLASRQALYAKGREVLKV